MIVLLDTNVCVDLLRNRQLALRRRLERMRPSDICLSAITVAELWEGTAASARPGFNETRLRKFLLALQVLPFDDVAAYEYGLLANELRELGKSIDGMDLLIAAHALATGCVLVTANVRDFSRVPGLQVQNWRR